MVTGQIEQLKQLQGILVERLAIERQLDDIPKNLVIKNELLERIRNRYKNNMETKEKQQQELNRLRIELEQNERDREKTEGQIGQVNTQREYEALEKEIREHSDKERTIREHQELLKNEISQLEESLEQEQELTKTQEEELQKEEQDMGKKSQKLRKDLERLEANEGVLAKDFSTEFLFKFRRILSTIGGRGIVPLTSAVCSDCHMVLPNHTVNEVRREKEILFCPYCSKVLYYATPDSAEGEGKSGGGGVTDADLVEEFEGPLGEDINFDDLFAGKELDGEYQEEATSDDEDGEGEEEEEEEEEGGGEQEVQAEDSEEYENSQFEKGGGGNSQVTMDDPISESYGEYEEDEENFTFDEES